MEAQLAGIKSAIENAKKGDIVPPPPVKLDLGCGKAKQPGHVGVDIRQFPGVDVVCDLSRDKWPWEDNSVDEAFSSHSLEHVPGKEVDYELVWDQLQTSVLQSGRGPRLAKKVTYPRAHFFNELWRVLKPGGRAHIITPWWASCRAYGDVTHEWPPVSEFFWAYLNKAWREQNAPHDDFYVCDFDHGYGYQAAPHVVGRSAEVAQQLIRDNKEAASDMQCTLTKRP